MKAIRVVLCDDHTLVRAGIRALLEREADIEVIGESGRGDEALGLISSLNPDVALVDIGMPGINGLQLTALLHQQLPAVRVVIVSVHRSGAYVRQSMADGARGYILKDAGPAELRDAVRTVARGELYLSPGAPRVREVRGAEHGGTNHDLSPRQREILELIAMGHTTKEIAVRLDLSVKTVETHRTELMRRLDIHDVAGLVRYAIRTGLVSAET